VPEDVFDVLREGSINQLSDERNVDVELIGVESGHPEILASEASKSQWILAVVTSDPKRAHRHNKPESAPARGGKTRAVAAGLRQELGNFASTIEWAIRQA
jgi:hypothetical protein